MYNSNWFHSLNKPIFAPPDYIFTPVWLVIYLLILISLILFLKTVNIGDKKVTLGVFIAQMLLNFLWSPVFFLWQEIFLAFIVIILMWVLILINIFLFYKYSKLSAILLIPYFLWVSFAGYLNFAYFILN